MPLIVPKKVSGESSSYTDIDASIITPLINQLLFNNVYSDDFILQERIDAGGQANNAFRIVTKQCRTSFRYCLGFNSSLEDLISSDLHTISEQVSKTAPPDLPEDFRLSWIISQATKLSLSGNLTTLHDFEFKPEYSEDDLELDSISTHSMTSMEMSQIYPDAFLHAKPVSWLRTLFLFIAGNVLVIMCLWNRKALILVGILVNILIALLVQEKSRSSWRLLPL